MKILVLCTGNSCRSQMAEGFLKAFDSRMEVYSAGTHPSTVINPKAEEVMKEEGIDINDGSPESVEDYIDQSFDYVITVCDDAKENCPVFAGDVKHRLHFGFDDPTLAMGTEEEKKEVFRRVRDEIKKEFKSLYENRIKQQIS